MLPLLRSLHQLLNTGIPGKAPRGQEQCPLATHPPQLVEDTQYYLRKQIGGS